MNILGRKNADDFEAKLIGGLGRYNVKVLAYKSKASGVVRVIFDPFADFVFNKGDILISGIARLEFIHIIKASAIVTDADGNFRHATIIARELGITGIVSTKNAKNILIDGDTIEVYAVECEIKNPFQTGAE